MLPTHVLGKAKVHLKLNKSHMLCFGIQMLASRM